MHEIERRQVLADFLRKRRTGSSVCKSVGSFFFLLRAAAILLATSNNHCPLNAVTRAENERLSSRFCCVR